MKKRVLVFILAAVMLMGTVGCSTNREAAITDEKNNATEVTAKLEELLATPEVKEDGENTAEKSEEPAKEEAEEDAQSHEVIVYFADWNLNDKPADKGGEVGSIAWDKVTMINHAFWEVWPADGSTESSFERRDAHQEARTEFTIVSTLPEADYLDKTESKINPGTERNHFAQYAYYSELYPDVDIMISIGGWSASGYFSEMAYTEQGRQSFINSCIDLIKQYPWIDGIDIDWEYPSGSNDGERYPEDESDEGCPIWGSALEERKLFPQLLKELKAALDYEFGEGKKLLTACASSSTGWTLPNQDWEAAAEYLDYINVMTYDMAGDWDGVTGHAGSGQGAKTAMAYFVIRDIPTAKLNIGSPMYGTPFLIDGEVSYEHSQGAKIKSSEGIDKDSLTIDRTDKFFEEAVTGYSIEYDENGKAVYGEEYDRSEGGSIKGWHARYDKKNNGAYLVNDDENSKYYGWFISYENELSLQAKFDLINQYHLAGIIVWESSEDSADNRLVSFMGDSLITK